MMHSGSSVSPLCSLVNAKARPSSGYSRMTLVGLHVLLMADHKIAWGEEGMQRTGDPQWDNNKVLYRYSECCLCIYSNLIIIFEHQDWTSHVSGYLHLVLFQLLPCPLPPPLESLKCLESIWFVAFLTSRQESYCGLP